MLRKQSEEYQSDDLTHIFKRGNKILGTVIDAKRGSCRGGHRYSGEVNSNKRYLSTQRTSDEVTWAVAKFTKLEVLSLSPFAFPPRLTRPTPATNLFLRFSVLLTLKTHSFHCPSTSRRVFPHLACSTGTPGSSPPPFRPIYSCSPPSSPRLLSWQRMRPLDLAAGFKRDADTQTHKQT